MLLFREPSSAVRKRSRREDLEFEVHFFRSLLRRDPGCVEALQILGDAYTKCGELRHGLRIDRRLARLCPSDPVVFYNLGCSLALLKRVDEAFVALERAVRLGYHDETWLARDPDLANLRQDRRFQRLRQRLTKKRT